MSSILRRWTPVVAAGVTAALVGAPALAAEPAAKTRAPALQVIVDCRKIADGAERLACFDRTVAQLDEAERGGEVVVVDKAQIQDARRAAFGFNFRMPSFMSSGEGGQASEGDDSLESTVDSARQGGDGKWTIRLPDGAIWVQTDNEYLPRAPKAGSKVTIRKGAMGGYFLSIDGQKSMRAKRQN